MKKQSVRLLFHRTDTKGNMEEQHKLKVIQVQIVQQEVLNRRWLQVHD